MRAKLIDKIKSLALDVDDDPLDWMDWNKYTNDDLLDLYYDYRLTYDQLRQPEQSAD